MLKILRAAFVEPPADHEIPAIYEELGLPGLGSYIEQRFEFTYVIGENERKGEGRIRYFKKRQEFSIIFSGALMGVGPVKINKLKEILLKELKEEFEVNIKSGKPKGRVIHADFGKKGRRQRKEE